MIIAENQLIKIINGILSTIRQDYDKRIDKKESLLYHFFGNQYNEDYDYFKNAVEFFLRKKDHPRHIKTRIFFDPTTAHIPTIHITLPSEAFGPNGIGKDEGYEDAEYLPGSKFRLVATRTFTTQFNIVFTSDNTYETLMMYRVLQAMMISFLDSIDLAGFQNIKLSGGDLNLNPDLIPPNIYMRVLSLNSNQEISVPEYIDRDLIIDILSKGSPKINN